MNLRATSLKPFCSKRSMILETIPRWTPSGLIMMKVRSRFAISARSATVSVPRNQNLV